MICTLHFHIVMENKFFAHFNRRVNMKTEFGKAYKQALKTEYFTRKIERELDNLQFFGESNGFPL